MKYSFSNIKDGSSILIMMHNGSVHMKLMGNIINLIREDIATISLETPTSHVLKFDHTELEVIYISEEGIPYIWKDAKIVHFKNNYVLQVKGEGTKYNRRMTYRVSIFRNAELRKSDDSLHPVTVNDISLTGFSVCDKRKELSLSKDDGVTIEFTDIEYTINLYGTVIRIEESDDSITYGFIIRRSCRDLPTYITTKLGDHRDTIPPSYII